MLIYEDMYKSESSIANKLNNENAVVITFLLVTIENQFLDAFRSHYKIYMMIIYFEDYREF